MPRSRSLIIAVLFILVLALGTAPQPAYAQPLTFVDETASAQVSYTHGYTFPLLSPLGAFDEPRAIAGGVAAGDYDNDGHIDLYAVRGDIGPNLLFRNLGDGTFEEVAADADVDLDAVSSSGPIFADIDGDGLLDLLVGGVGGTSVSVFRNEGDKTFEDVTATTGFATGKNTFGAAFGDYDRDGDLDAVLSHWATPMAPGVTSETLWRNDGSFSFTDVSLESGITAILFDDAFLGFDLTFTPNFVDIDSDGWLDLLLANDFKQSKVLRNEGDGTFADYTAPGVITDENGMGAAIGDYDNDGVLDWFVSSIWDPSGSTIENWGVTGNRLYRGLGDGTFEDVTDVAGVREGFWGWGATFADFDNDGDLDLFHTNGWGAVTGPPTDAFYTDPARFFVSDGEGAFAEQSASLGVVDTGHGRGVVAFDQERDGDLDLFVSNNRGPSRFFRNGLGNEESYLTVRLRGLAPNTQAIGARVYATTDTGTQMREIRAGSNFESQDPAEAHFGLGASNEIFRVRVVWPLGGFTDLGPIAVNQILDVAQTAASCGNGVVETTAPYSEECDQGAANGTGGSDCQVNCLFPAGVSPCAVNATIEQPRLRVTGIGNPGKGRARIRGDVQTVAGIDPVTEGLRASVLDGAGDPAIEILLPGGLWNPAAGSGWRASRDGTRFRYRSPVASARVTLKSSGRVRIRVVQKHSTYALDASDEPFVLKLAFDPTAANPAVCAAASFSPYDCRSRRGRLRCRDDN